MKQEVHLDAEKDVKSRALSRANFKVGLVLLIICAAFFVHTLSFPMTGSYGGVENQWYVSPALFPLSVLSILMILSVILIIKAWKDCDYFNVPMDHSGAETINNRKNIDKWYVIILLCLYVYVYIPSADFYLVTCLFVLSLILRFYLQLTGIWRWVLYVHIPLTIVLLSVRSMNSEAFSWFLTESIVDEPLILINDLCSVTALFLLLLSSVINLKSKPAKLVRVLMYSMLIPLILICIFSFVLYVPMPVEYGSVSSFLNYFVYEVLGV
ncbi:tripartite tricarboxylate transporter TctB family protein [Colwellia sp. MSW7]|uniref:Tripartite tricarboxylate transporter TctB family protein n=1 Tax=Colwellia maritima TaxID=2912588 RepID=A0ABS9WXN3_9GAMM|nr:tripartite tricarboxylate transporter TctB family protein [Colwellia maritima]MCI2282755.1 tripartite tricarboxylate transporter TctB family protein [Colwellia maritima]